MTYSRVVYYKLPEMEYWETYPDTLDGQGKKAAKEVAKRLADDGVFRLGSVLLVRVDGTMYEVRSTMKFKAERSVGRLLPPGHVALGEEGE